MFEPFQKFVRKAAGHYGVSVEVEAAEVCSAFRGLLYLWFDEAEEVKEFVDAAFFKAGVLVIKVESPAFAQEIIVRRERIITDVNQKLGRNLVKELRIKLGN